MTETYEWPHSDDPETNPLVGKRTVWSAPPANEYEALLVCMPHQEPAASTAEAQPLRELLADAIDALPPRERLVFVGYYVERLTMRVLAEELGVSKTTIGRIRDRAAQALRDSLIGVIE